MNCKHETCTHTKGGFICHECGGSFGTVELKFDDEVESLMNVGDAGDAVASLKNTLRKKASETKHGYPSWLYRAAEKYEADTRQELTFGQVRAFCNAVMAFIPPRGQ